MATNKPGTPELRFPEFQNDGEWESMLVGDAIKVITPPKKLLSSEYKSKGKFPIIDQSLNYIAGYSDDNTALLNTQCADYVVFGDHTCTLKLINFPFIQGADGIKIFQSKHLFISTQFLYQYLLAHPICSNEYRRHFSDLKEMKFFYSTDIGEQKKIATCLTSLDNYIDAKKQKLRQLREHQKGLMQRLFPANGKALPEFRFPEFQNTPEWAYKQLCDIGETYGGLSGKSAEDFGTGKPYVTYKQVFGGLSIDFSGCLLVQITEKEKQNRLQYGDVLVTMSSETPEEIGYTAIVAEENIPECYLNSFCFIYRLFDNKSINLGFLTYLFRSDIYRMNMVRIAQGITRFNISKTRFKEIKLPIPVSIDEQYKIAETLATIDNQIKYCNNQIKLLELHKQGVMQQLFPKS